MPDDSCLPDPLRLVLPGDVPLALRRIPPGSFRMGQRGGSANEEPVHRVIVPQASYLGVVPVTQAQYCAMAGVCLEELRRSEGNRGPEPSHFRGDDLPVESVSWDDARCVCRWLSGSGLLPAGWVADLPSEAAWEYACRGGTETAYWSGDQEEDLDRVGWYGGNAGGTTHPVGAKGDAGANPFGLHDLHGNVWEWCLDYYDPRRYRRRIECAPASASLDAEDVEFDSADPTLVAIAEMLGRFATGQFDLKPEDTATLAAYRGLAETAVQNGNEKWTPDVQAAKAALRNGRWPDGAQGVASTSLPSFRNAIEAVTNRSYPARVVRGGAWSFTAAYSRSAFRVGFAPGDRDRFVGFRLAVVPGPVSASVKQAVGAERLAGGEEMESP